MSIIGTLKKLENGSLDGKIKTMTLDVKVKLLPNDQKEDKDSRPNYKVKINGYEAGGAWEETSEKGNPYLSLQIDDPMLPKPLYANLVKTETEENNYLLFWNR